MGDLAGAASDVGVAADEDADEMSGPCQSLGVKTASLPLFDEEVATGTVTTTGATTGAAVLTTATGVAATVVKALDFTAAEVVGTGALDVAALRERPSQVLLVTKSCSTFASETVTFTCLMTTLFRLAVT